VRLEGKRVLIVAGSGGVGKTTTAAALALGLAAEGKRVAVVTIDPARRLADALGLDALGNEPHRVDPARLEPHGVTLTGELWAMMLDSKRTFDELIAHLAPDERTREEILDNRIYQQLSGTFGGSQEFTAIAKLYELERSGRFDVLVLDTPPSRNALDFLDAPDRLTQFFDGRALKLFVAPTGFAAKVAARGTSVVFGILSRVTGVNLLDDIGGFLRALTGVMDGFRERAASVQAILEDDATTFLIVTSAHPEPVEEAIFFHSKLRESQMPFGGLIVNRVEPRVTDADPGELESRLGERLAAKVARTLADAQILAARDRGAIARLAAELGDPDTVLVPELDGDVHDVEGLVAITRHLFGLIAPLTVPPAPTARSDR
jgi:anion-transporting  ArsA/GET3 family ATPase